MEAFVEKTDNPTFKFVKEEAPKIHPAFSSDCEYDHSIGRPVPARDYRQWPGLENDVDDLRNAVVEYQHANPESIFENINLETCSWSDVFQQMEDAQVQYDERDKHGLGIFRATWRKLGRKENLGKEIDPWLDLIPGDYGLSVVRGAIVLVLMAARRYAENHQKVLNYVVEIMQTVSRACPRCRVFGRNQRLDQSTRKLYVSVLETIALIVRYLNRKVDKRVLSRIGDKIRPAHNVRDEGISNNEQAMAVLRTKTQNFQDTYDMHKDEALSRSFQVQDFTLEQVNALQETLEDYGEKQNKILQLIKGFQSPVISLFALLSESGYGKDRIQSLDRQLLSTSEGHSPLRSRAPVPAYSLQVTMEEVVLRLGIASDMANDDLEKVAADRPWLDRQAYSTAQSLVNFSQFRDWFTGTGSRILFVEGEDLGEPGGSSSVLSTLNVDIMSNLLKSSSPNRQIAVLYFFCGLRTREDEGPRSMLKSLIVQLLLILRQYKTLNLGFVRTKDDIDDLQQGKLRALLSTIQQLVQQLPPYLTVYCFIDGISSYESRLFDSDGFENAMENFVSMIQHVVLVSQAAQPDLDLFHTTSRMAPVKNTGMVTTFNFKVFLTSPDRTRLCHNLNQRIVLSDGGLHSNGPSDPIYGAFEAEGNEFGF